MRQKTCKGCGDKFKPERPLQVVCGPICAWRYTGQQNAKTDRRLTREAKAKLKTRSDWMREAQAAVNKWIRSRDANEPCISCQRHHTGQYHAGHYRSTKAAPELRFEPLNIHKQCSACNTHLSGNIVEYRRHLIAKIGPEKVEWIEGKHEAKHYSVDELKSIKDKYSKLAKELA